MCLLYFAMQLPPLHKSKSMLNQQIADHSTMFTQGVKNSNIFMMSFVMYGAIQRSLWNTQGFLKNIDDSYMISAVLLRCQMDTLMRLYAYNLHSDPNKMAQQVLYKNAKFRDFYVIENGKKERFTDTYLHKRLNRIYPWFSGVYEMLSGFVHFGDVYGRLPIESTQDQNGEGFVNLRISPSDSIAVTDKSRAELAACMADTTDIILTFIASFLDGTKIRK